VPRALHSAKILDYTYKRFEKMAALHKWLVALNMRTG
jgi:hypothetical protein